MKLDTDLPELNQVDTPETPQARVNSEYATLRFKLEQAKAKRYFQACLEAQMYLSVHDEKRAIQVLSQALTS